MRCTCLLWLQKQTLRCLGEGTCSAGPLARVLFLPPTTRFSQSLRAASRTAGWYLPPPGAKVKIHRFVRASSSIVPGPRKRTNSLWPVDFIPHQANSPSCAFLRFLHGRQRNLAATQCWREEGPRRVCSFPRAVSFVGAIELPRTRILVSLMLLLFHVPVPRI